jgi:hypothetical protein
MKNLQLLTLALLCGIASSVKAGLFHETDEDHTAITGRRKMHVLHGGESKSERRESRAERTSNGKKTVTKTSRSVEKQPGRATKRQKTVTTKSN